MNGYVPEGLKEPIMIHVLDVDEDYLKVMGIPLKALMQESAIPGKPYSGFLYWPFSLPGGSWINGWKTLLTGLISVIGYSSSL